MRETLAIYHILLIDHSENSDDKLTGRYLSCSLYSPTSCSVIGAASSGISCSTLEPSSCPLGAIGGAAGVDTTVAEGAEPSDIETISAKDLGD